MLFYVFWNQNYSVHLIPFKVLSKLTKGTLFLLHLFLTHINLHSSQKWLIEKFLISID